MAYERSARLLTTIPQRALRRRSVLISFTLALAALVMLPSALCQLAIALLLVAASVVDLATYRIPDAITLPLIILAAASAATEPDDRILGLVGAPTLLWLVRCSFLKIKGYHGLGLGDVKLVAACGAMVGIAQIGLLLFGSALLALLVITVWHSWRLHRPNDHDGIPLRLQPVAFGPFIVCATFFIILCQQEGLWS